MRVWGGGSLSSLVRKSPVVPPNHEETQYDEQHRRSTNHAGSWYLVNTLWGTLF